MKQPFIREMVRDSVAGLVNHPGGGGAAAIIAGLFAQGQQGFWLPFTDFASLSQDSAGTLPYTALEQPVGRVLDRSGRGNHASQATSTARGKVSAAVVSPPTRPYYLQLDGTDDFYTCGGGGSTTGFYYSDVIRPSGTGPRVLFSDRDFGAKGFEAAVTSANKINLIGGTGAAYYGPTSTDIAPNDTLTHVAMWDDMTNLCIQVNGGAVITAARPAILGGRATVTLGKALENAGYFNGQITEPIYRAGPPPNAYEREVIRNYQMQKAGMA